MTTRTLVKRVQKVENRLSPRNLPIVCLELSGNEHNRQISVNGKQIKLEPPFKSTYAESNTEDIIPTLVKHGLWDAATMNPETDLYVIRYVPKKTAGHSKPI